MDNKNKKVVNNDNVKSSSLDDNKPQIVVPNVEKEVNEVKPNSFNSTDDKQIPTSTDLEKTTKEKKKGHPVFLVLLIIFLFAFVFFLPEISQFITDYRNERMGINQLKSGRMTCTMNNETNNINYTYQLEFNYNKNKLKESTATTTSRLSDNAKDTSILTERQDSCLLLKEVLDENEIGMSVSCDVSAVMQRTVQNIDYRELNLDFISTNIAEFEGFYPEYELDESVTSIENDLENSGYTCKRSEY